MINEKLNEIDLDLKIVQSLVKNNDYLKVVEDNCKKNNEREEKIRELQDRINKAIEYIETKSEKQYGFNFEYNLEEIEIQDLIKILKGE